MYKILILGNGFIGNNLYQYFSNKYQTSITNKEILDVTCKDIKFDLNLFDIIICAAGIKNVEFCNQYPNICFDVNSYGVKNIISKLDKNKKFIYISTDYVFDGSKGLYSENDYTNPPNIYGHSKLFGEILTSQHDNHIVVRTSGVFGKGCPWLQNLLIDLDNAKNIECYSDIYNSPTYVINLAEMMEDLIKLNFVGTINLCGSERSNRFHLYRSVSDIFKKDTSLLSEGYSKLNFPKDISLVNHLYCKLSKKIPNNIQEGLIRLSNEN